MHAYSCVMGEPSWRTPSALDRLHIWSSVPGPYVLPHPHLLPGKASPQAGEEAQGDAGGAVPGKQHLAWAPIAVPR